MRHFSQTGFVFLLEKKFIFQDFRLFLYFEGTTHAGKRLLFYDSEYKYPEILKSLVPISKGYVVILSSQHLT